MVYVLSWNSFREMREDLTNCVRNASRGALRKTMAIPSLLRKREPPTGFWFDKSPSRKASWRWFDCQGKPHYIGKRAHYSYEEAYDIFVAQAWASATHPPNNVTVIEMWMRFCLEALGCPWTPGIGFPKEALKKRVRGRAAPADLRSYDFASKFILPQLGEGTLIRDLDFGTFQVYKKSIRAKYQNKFSYRNILSRSNKFLSHAEAHNILDAYGNRWVNTLPVVKLPPDRVIEEEEEQGWTPELELAQQLCHAPNGPFDKCWQLECCTSAGPAEVFGLQNRDLDLDRRVMSIRRNWDGHQYGPPKTNSRRRKDPIPDALVESLRAHRATSKYQRPNDPVFAQEDGTPQNQKNFDNALKAAAKKLPGQPHTEPYGGRRFFASVCDDLDVDIHDIDLMMGRKRRPHRRSIGRIVPVQRSSGLLDEATGPPGRADPLPVSLGQKRCEI